MIDLFKDQFVADLVLIKIAFDLIDTDILAKRFPQVCPVIFVDQEDRQRTRGGLRIVNLVIGVVWKKRAFRISPAAA